MAYSKRTPSIKITVDIEVFNSLVERLVRNSQLNVDSNDFSNEAERLKEKLLTYSVPRINEDESEIIDIRFFPNEASMLIEQLLVSSIPEEIETDYYSVLVKVREARSEERKNNS